MPKKPEKSSALSILKQKLAGKEGSAFEILDDVKKVRPEQWRSSAQVEKMTRKYIDKLGISVPEQRIKQFLDAFMDVTKNGSNVDEIIQKYGKNVDEGTKKAIKKYTKSK